MIVYSFYRTDGDSLELIMINSEKIKIMLNREDMTRYDIQIYSLGHTGSAIKETFRQVLSEIKEQTGFDTLSGKALFQVYPSKDGGCEIYITRFKDLEQCDNLTNNTDKNAQAKQNPKKRFKNTVFYFESLTDTMDACKSAKADGYSRKSSLYKGNDGFYLILENEIRPKNAPDELVKLNDYGTKINSKVFEAYIHEHMEKIITKNAVEALSM